MIELALARTGSTLIITDEVFSHFHKFRQTDSDSKEAGGQLFAKFKSGSIVVERVTGPRASDRRTPFSFIPDRFLERREIKKLFREGFHYIGDWHTHFEVHPSPSPTDERSINETFLKSHHQLASFVLVIVGTAEGADGLFVGVTDGRRLRRIFPIPKN